MTNSERHQRVDCDDFPGRIVPAESVAFDRESVENDGKVVQLLTRTALIKMKSASSRLKDQLDVELLNDQADER